MHAIETGEAIQPNFYDGLAEMQVLEAAAHSARTGEKKSL
jgi:predicted dehydrogenase